MGIIKIKGFINQANPGHYLINLHIPNAYNQIYDEAVKSEDWAGGIMAFEQVVDLFTKRLYPENPYLMEI